MTRRGYASSRSRLLLILSIGMTALLLFAASARAQQTFTVNTNADSNDYSADATTCTDGGTCSLRDAILTANADTGDTSVATGDTIAFSVTGTITLESALPAITAKYLTITGPGAGSLTVSGANAYTVFTIGTGATVSISGLTIADGNFLEGGGIDNDGGTVTVINSTISGNQATSGGEGGGIFNYDGTLTLTNSTISGNQATSGGEGGGIFNYDGTLTVLNSTISGNTASGTDSEGGGINNDGGSLAVENSTISGNTATIGGGIDNDNDNGTVTVTNSILTGDTGGECSGSGCPTNGSAGNLVGTAAKLLPLGNYGGTTETMLPLPGSAAIGAGSAADVPSGVTTDQRGFAFSSTVDAGAVQTNYVKATSSLPRSYSGLEDVDLTGLSGTVSANLAISSGQVNLIGLGANLLTLSGDNMGKVITVDSGAQAVLYGLTLANGNSLIGGGIFNAGGTLAVENSTISGNIASGTDSVGGGIYNEGGTVTVINSTISGNQATSGGEGGGIFNYDGTLTLTNSTISGNTASGIFSEGGGIFNEGGTVTVLNSTISGNTASGTDSLGGGINNDGGSLAVENSTISGNTASGTDSEGGGILLDGANPVLNLTNSIVSGNTASTDNDIGGSVTNNGGNEIGVSGINLAALGYYGGPTQTMPPLTGSPALEAGSYVTGETTTDQRGAPRPSTSGATIDSGSVQISNEPPVILAVTPNNGSTAGGTSVTITGTGLDGSTAADTAVDFGTGNAASGVTINAGTGTSFASITATSPGGSGTVDVTVTNDYGTSATSSSDQFTYWTPVAISPLASAGALTATYGSSFTPDFSVSGGSGSYTLTNSGTLPTGLTLTPSGSATGTSWTLSGTPTQTGSFSFTLTATDSTYSTNTVSQTYTLSVGKATATVTLGSLSQTYTGSPLSATATTNPTGLTVDFTYSGNGYGPTSTPPTAVGSYSVTATVNDPNYQGSASGVLTINAETATVTLGNLTQTYTGSPLSATATTNPSGLTVSFTYNGSSTAPTAAGTYVVVGTITGSATYQGSATGQMTINKATATVTLTPSSLSPTYTGSPLPATATTTNPTGLTVGFTYSSPTYSSSSTAPTAAGSYTVVGTINNANYQGSATGTLTISQAQATVTLASLSQTYTGSPLPATAATTNPTGLTVNFTYSSATYPSTSTPPTNAGTYTVVGTISNANYQGSATGTLTIGQAQATVILTPASLSQTYTGSPISAAATTNPTGLTVNFTYSSSTYPSSSTPPTAGGSYTVTGTINNANYTGSATGTLAIGKLTPVVNLTSSLSSSTVNQQVVFTAKVTPANAALTGSVNFIDEATSTTLCSSVALNNNQASCLTSSLTAGKGLTIEASYSGDSNSSSSNGTVMQTVSAATSATTVTSSPDPSVASNPNNDSDTVTITAQVTPISGPVLPSGSVTFTNNGAPIPECLTAVAVTHATGLATCTTTSLGSGSHTIEAAYNNDPNFTASAGTATQQVQDYVLTASPASAVTVTQGFTSSNDPFSPQSVSASATPIAGFSGNLALTCNVVAVTAVSGAVLPTCTLGSSTLAIPASGTPQPVAITIDAGSGSTPVASPGSYSVSLLGVDATTGLTRSTASFTVNVRYKAAALTIESGATTGNASTIAFTLPESVGIPSLQCLTVTGPTLTSSVAPVALSIGCAFSPASIPSSGSIQSAPVSVTISTGATTTAQLNDHNGKATIVVAGLLGIPILALLGFMPGGKSSRKIFFRFLGIAFVLVTLLQGIGCGGGSFTAPPSVSGQTPPGSYNILVQGTGSDNQSYQAVVVVNVTR